MTGWSRFARLAIGTIAAAVLSGCATGAIYTQTTLPLDTNFDDTPSGIEGHEAADPKGAWTTIRLPTGFLFGFGLYIDWGDASVASALEDAGIETVHYADLEITSILTVWTQRKLRVYGE